MPTAMKRSATFSIRSNVLVARTARRPVMRVYCRSLSNNPNVVIIGGGIAGLLTASVLSKRVDKVVMVEKDNIHGRVDGETFYDTAKRRHGVPHINQPHQLALGAVQALDILLPNFRDQAIAAGGLDLDLAKHVLYFDYNAYYPRQSSNLKGLGVSRRFVEQLIRDRVFKEAKETGTLEVVSGKVEDFLWDQDTVTGVKLSSNVEIKAPLVIDTSGRSSETAARIERHNLPKPRLMCVNPNVASASKIVKMPKDWAKNNDWLLLVCKSQPHGNRGGTMLPMEDSRWQVTLAEVGGPGPETTEEGFLEFAKNLPDSTLYNVLKDCEPVTGVMRYMAMRNEMVCYHEIDMPRGLLAVGDAVMRLNALYGQGIAASSQSVLLLEKTLDEALKGLATEEERKEALATLGRTFQPKLADRLAYPTTTASNISIAPPSRTDQLVTDTLLTAAQNDPVVYQRLLEVAHLTKKPADIFADFRTWGPLLRAGINVSKNAAP